MADSRPRSKAQSSMFAAVQRAKRTMPQNLPPKGMFIALDSNSGDEADSLEPTSAARKTSLSKDLHSPSKVISFQKSLETTYKTAEMAQEILNNLEESGNIKREIKQAITDLALAINDNMDVLARFIGMQAAEGIDKVIKSMERSATLIKENTSDAISKIASYSAAVDKGSKLESAKEQRKPAVNKAAMSSKVKPDPSIVIGSKDEKLGAKELCAKIKSTIKPAKVNAAVSGIRLLGKNKVLISCPTREDMNKMKTAVQDVAVLNGFTVEDRKQTTTYVRIKGVWKETTDDEIYESLYNQNGLEKTFKTFLEFKNVIKIVSVKSNARGFTKDVLFTASPAICKYFEGESKISIGFQKLLCKTTINPLQCYKCYAFGHRGIHCKDTDRCPHCAGEHTSKDCPKKDDDSQRKCINCCRFNHQTKNFYAQKKPNGDQQPNTSTSKSSEQGNRESILQSNQRNTDHNAYYKGCPEYIRYTESLWEKTQYVLNNYIQP